MQNLLKKTYFLFFSFFLFNSCSEKIELIGNFNETAVIYGVLDQSDSLHYIKINRAFIGPGNALDIAQIPDSSYFDQVEATVSEWVNGVQVRSWLLSDTIIDNKETNGVFYAPEQKLYYFKTLPTNFDQSQQISSNPQETSLNINAIYKINIVLNGGEFEVNGETELVKNISTNTSSQNFTFKFIDNNNTYKSTGVTVSNTGTSHIINTSLQVRFYEYIGTSWDLRSFNWNLGESDVSPGQAKTFSAVGETFYNLTASNCSDNTSITKRTFGGIEITIVGGAQDLYNYMLVNQPSSSLAQNKPTYTNLTVSENDKNVIGIFSSRQTVKSFKPFYTTPQQAYIRAIDKNSTRELCIGPFTGLYLFCSNHPGDNIVGSEESFACP
ncbi:MAG: hypothetical protein CL824_03790 [Crocinitomicaceae bacterium]|nr:hypothetical protein [Crocinitomicaceae bacterium]